ncbi:hypothetical protein [uncultured Methanobrevibacter sp.]|uniref:hypothetical protein n=1 Tax=uncultured Methanobrevibacter sp. TaxID=253161 RepID=UPI0025FDBC63|nr:hypothetical protein [uncultured Methanobrevibacter sp.]
MIKLFEEYIDELSVNEAKITFSQCPDWSFQWIAVKDRWASKGDAKYSYTLVCIPNDKEKEIVVFPNYAWYTGGYDQGYASTRKYYLNTICGGGGVNGHGREKETVPYSFDLESDIEDLNNYLNTGKYYSTSGTEKLDKIKRTYPHNTKISEIKQQL